VKQAEAVAPGGSSTTAWRRALLLGLLDLLAPLTQWQKPNCRLHTCQANAEPPFLGRHRIQIQYWGGAIAALETLILRVGSLEAVLTSPEPLLNELRLQELLGEPHLHPVMSFSHGAGDRHTGHAVAIWIRSRRHDGRCWEQDIMVWRHL
jgi:hypothetical protein